MQNSVIVHLLVFSIAIQLKKEKKYFELGVHCHVSEYSVILLPCCYFIVPHVYDNVLSGILFFHYYQLDFLKKVILLKEISNLKHSFLFFFVQFWKDIVEDNEVRDLIADRNKSQGE